MSAVRRYIQRQIADNLAHPQKGFFGWLVNRVVFEKNNVFLTKQAVHLCEIQPHYDVLEIGYAAGIALKEAATFVKDGPGRIYGVDISLKMFDVASKRLKTEVCDGRVQLDVASVLKLPYNTSKFDRVFHTNCYYFWPEPDVAAREIYRVLKPGAKMVTAIDSDCVAVIIGKGMLTKEATDKLAYMSLLESVGFIDVRIEYITDVKKPFQVMYAKVGEKPELQYPQGEEEGKTSQATGINTGG